MSDTQQKKLTAAEIDSLREIHIPINLEGLRKGWNKIFYEWPFSLYQGATRGIEGYSRKLLTGKASLLSMPVGIILRNTSRAAHNSSEGRYLYTARIVGGVAAIGAVVGATMLGGPLLAGMLPAVVSGFLGSVGTYIAAGAAAALVLPIPVFTAATLTTSTLVGGAIAALSTVPAVANLVVAARRSKFSAQGYKFSDEDVRALEERFDRESPSARYERKTLEQVTYGLSHLPENRRLEIFEGLKKDFAEAAKKKQEEEQQLTATASAVPTAKRKREL